MVAFGFVGRDFGRREDRAQKEPGAEIAADEIGVLALPAKTRCMASGFSITGAVSTKTLTSAPERLAILPASSFSLPLMMS